MHTKYGREFCNINLWVCLSLKCVIICLTTILCLFFCLCDRKSKLMVMQAQFGILQKLFINLRLYG